MSNEGMRREVEGMSDGELQREIAGMRSFGGFLFGDKRARHQRFLPLLEAEALHRRTRKDAAKVRSSTRVPPLYIFLRCEDRCNWLGLEAREIWGTNSPVFACACGGLEMLL
jgi:hypothetical protein